MDLMEGNTTLQMQLDELELMRSMFSSNELVIHNAPLLAQLEQYLSHYPAAPRPEGAISFSVKIPISLTSPDSSTQPTATMIELECSLSKNYPHLQPQVAVRCADFERGAEAVVLEDLKSYASSHCTPGEPCILTLIQWLQENAPNYLFSNGVKNAQSLNEKEGSTLDGLIFAREWFWFHHIYGKKKRKHLQEWAHELGITGLCLAGKPGVVVIEGEKEAVKQWTQRVRSLSWQKMTSKLSQEEKCTGLHSMLSHRRFSDFSELQGGVGALHKVLQERNLHGVLNDIIGVETKV